MRRPHAIPAVAMLLLLPAAAAGADAPADPNSPAAEAETADGGTPRDPNAPIPGGTERVTVTGERDEASGAPTSFLTVVRPSDHAWRTATLADLLGETVGVRVRSYGGLNSFATVSIRGSTAEQVAVFLDGAPLNSPLGGGVNLADVPLAGLETIEVHRGFAPASLGASSIGGAIQLKTRRPPGTGGGAGSLSYGSFATGTLGALADWTAGPARWTASAEGTSTQGDFSFLDNNGTELDPSDDGVHPRENNASWSSALRVRGETDLPGGRGLSLSAEWGRRRQGVPGIDAYQCGECLFALQRGLVRAAASWSGDGAGGWDAEAALDHEYTSQEFTDPETGITPSPQDQTTRVASTGARLRLAWKPSEAQRLSVLVEPRLHAAEVLDHLNATVEPIRARRISLDAVAEDEIRLASGRFLLAPSLRWDGDATSSLGGSPGAPAADSGNAAALSGRLGGLVVLSRRWSLRANVGRFHRVPGLLELYGNEGTLVGNPALRPESGVNADAGFALHAAGPPGASPFTMEIAVFRTDAEDLIQLVPLPSRVVKAFNAGRARITGVEASASLRLFGRLTASGNYTRQKPADLSDTFRGGGDLPGRPREEADSFVSLDLGRAVLYHRFSFVGENDISAVAASSLPSVRRPLTRLPARYLHDAGVKVRLGRGVEASLEVANLLDRRVADVARYPLPGRAVFGKVSARF